MEYPTKLEYGYSYVNNDGKGFSSSEPFICSEFDSLAEAKKSAREAANKFGIKDVRFFAYDEELPEYVSLDFIEKHTIG